MQKLPKLQINDHVEIIAPASRCTAAQLRALQTLLTSWGLHCITAENLFGDDFLCAQKDEVKFHLFKEALARESNKALICARGGYGSMRLLPYLSTIKPPLTARLLIGMSDITALHLFVYQHWGWPSLYCTLNVEKFSASAIDVIKAAIFGEIKHLHLCGTPLNQLAAKHATISSIVIGGNLSLIQTSIGTNWQMDARGKIVLLEDINERGYKIDRMLQHLHQANLLQGAVAILLGDFLGGAEADGSSLINPVLQRFAQACSIPVFQVANIGHGIDSLPVPLGVKVSLQLGKTIHMNFDL